MDLSILLAAVILLQFCYIVMLDRQHLTERKDLYDRIMGVYAPVEKYSPAPKGKSPIHKSVDPELEERLKRDGLYQ